MNHIVAVVVTYNRKELLKECIENLLLSDTKCDILVVDNHSTDGTEKSIYEYIQRKDIVYWNTGSNLGGAGGFSYGIRKAIEMGYDYVWLMDDDCMVHRDTLTEFVKAHNKIVNERNEK